MLNGKTVIKMGYNEDYLTNNIGTLGVNFFEHAKKLLHIYFSFLS